MAKELKVCCPDCGTFFTAEYGWWHKTQKCPNCKHKVNLREERMKTVECPHCKNSVVYDALSRKANTCPVCNGSLDHPVQDARYQEVSCPQCGVVTKVLPGTGGKHTCLLCEKEFDIDLELAKKELPGTSNPQLIEQKVEGEFLVWKHPLNKFSFQSRLKVNEGHTAVCLVDGECRYPAYPGSHPLAESPLNDRDKFEAAARGEDVSFTTDIYFVRNRIDGTFPWGTMNPPVVQSGDTKAQVRASGSVTLEICDPKAFLNKWGYRNRTSAEVCDPAKSPLVPKVRETISTAFARALRDLVNDNGWDVLSLDEHLEDIAEEVARYADRTLETYGVQIESLNIANFQSEETKASADEKNEAIRKQENLETMLRQVQSRLEWTSAPLHVHMRDNAALCADITVGGGCTLVLVDEETLMARPRVQNWLKSGASDAVVKSHLTELVNELLMNVLYDVVQSMVDATNADVRELSRYYGHLRGTMSEYLNSALKSWGLQVETFSMQEKQMAASAALSAMTINASRKTEATIQQDMNNFTRTLEIEEETANSTYRIQKRSIQVNESVAMDNQDILEADSKDKRADVMTGYAIKDMDRQDLLARHQAELNARREDDAMARKQAREMKTLNYVSELAARRGQISAEEKQRVYDDIYREWQNSAQLEEAKLKAQMAANDAVQAHQLTAQRREQEAQLSAERAAADQRRILSDIMRKIDESDLDWRKKQDAYDRLLRNAQSEDYAANLSRESKAEVDADYLRKHLNITLSKEQNDLLEEIKQRSEEREERIRRNKFAREMEEKKLDIATQMQLLKMEAEQNEKAAAAAERIAAQAAEIEKLELTLKHYEVIGSQNLDAARVKAAAETARQKAEREYAERHEARMLNAEANRSREQRQRENDCAARAEDLLKQMWSINTSLEAMKLNNQREYNAGLAHVEEVRASRINEDQLRSLTDAMEAISKRMGSVETAAAMMGAAASAASEPMNVNIKVTSDVPPQQYPQYPPYPQYPQHQPTQPQYPQYPQYQPQPGFQTGGMGNTEVLRNFCPACHHELPLGVSYCPFCQSSFGK